MVRGTTPPITIVLPTAVSNYKVVLLTFENASGATILEKGLSDMTVKDECTLEFRLTQEETLAFPPKAYVNMQIRAVTNDDIAYATVISRVFVDDVLNEDVLPEAQDENNS